MTEDARFEDAGEAPLNLGALDAEDLQVISALCQDAVLPATEMTWDRRARRLVLLVNRIRHEDVAAAQRQKRAVERVRALLVIDGVLGVASQGLDRRDGDTVLQVLSVSFEPGDAPGGAVTLTLAGDGAIRATVEALDVTLRDVTRPYAAPSGRLPDHGD
jgi:hypothetical protein